jgi:mRNA interferase HigB
VLRSGNIDTLRVLRQFFRRWTTSNTRTSGVPDIGGNNLRLIAFAESRDNRMYLKHIATHAEYDKLCKRYRKERD